MHKKNKHIRKNTKTLVAEYWEDILEFIEPLKHGVNSRLSLPDLWKPFYTLFVSLDSHLNMAKSRKSGVLNSVTLPMISSMFAQGEHKRFSQKHLARILAVVPEFFTATWVFKKDKFELCIDYPVEETT